ncbi:hypothetical protein BDV59DRAFT_204874 [Aspergillus ambiguus]|uniref:uncharacterized protein n=1 Tax=Aspergillus ambiguus TaxID=176160 RepID=UPI003CCE3D35
MRFLCFILFFVFLADAKLTFDWDCSKSAGEGGQLSAFYRKLNDGDKFGITVKNFKNAPSCNTNKCKNDGGQFKMNSQGNFVNDKRSLDQGRDFTEEFVDDTVQGDEDRDAAPLRMLESDDGTLHLIILEDVNDPIGVGDELWTEDGTVRVSRLLN